MQAVQHRRPMELVEVQQRQVLQETLEVVEEVREVKVWPRLEFQQPQPLEEHLE